MITLTYEEAEQLLAAFCQSSQPASGYRRNELHLTPKSHVALYNEAIELLRAALSQPEREWVGLTDEERYLGDARSEQEIEYAKTIEAKLKEKNT